MPLESVTHISDLVATNPTSSDPKSQGDDHIRNIKVALKTDFPAINSPVLASSTELNTLVGMTVQPAAKDGSNLTTPATGDSSTKIATTQFVTNVAMAAALPGQGASSKHKFPGSNGAIAGWRSAGLQVASPAGGALTNGATVQMFVANASYVLPDFTGSDSFGIGVPSNASAVPSSLQTSDGWTISPGFSAGSLAVLMPSSAMTPHGTWGSTPMTPPGNSIAAGGAPAVLGTAQLSATLAVILFLVSGASLYAVAVNPATGAAGTPQLVAASSGLTAHVYADSATTFVVGYSNGVTSSVIAGLVSGLVVTFPNSAAAGTYGYRQLIQLTTGTYVHSSGNEISEPFTVSGTLVTRGTNAAPSGMTGGTIIRVSATQFLEVGFSTSTSPCQLVAALGTIVGGNVSFGGTASAATTICKGSAVLRFLRSLSPGGPFVACAQDNTTATTGDYYGITVSGSVITIGAALQLASALAPVSLPQTWIASPANAGSQYAVPYSANTLLVGHPSGATALTVSGTSLSAGPTYGASLTTFTTDVATGASYYAQVSGSTSKISVAAGVISAAFTLAVTPIVIGSDVLNDKAVNYSATWYSWNLPAMACAITPTTWVYASGNNLVYTGAIS